MPFTVGTTLGSSVRGMMVTVVQIMVYNVLSAGKSSPSEVESRIVVILDLMLI